MRTGRRATPAAAPLGDDLTLRRRGLVMACLMVAMSMVALEATIVATAVPQIVGALHGASLYGWVFSAFLLTQAITTPLWGRLADIYGRRAVLTAGLGLFLLGSLVCGAATSMAALVAARALQGLGAGCVQPICTTVVGDLYHGEERTRAQGWLSSVWGPSAVIAPMVGAALIATLGWPWVFWINLAPGLVALAGVRRCLPEAPRVRPAGRQPIDVAGAIAFAVFACAALLALTQLARGTPAGFAAAAGFALVAAVAAPVLLWIERRAPAPVIALDLWSQPVIAGANAVTLAGCVALTGVTVLLPLYVQDVLGGSALSAGFTVTAMAVGWPIAAMSARAVHTRLGLRRTLVLGAALLIAGALVFTTLGAHSPLALAFVGSLVAGMGMGLLTLTGMVLIQAHAAAADRGAATSSNIFARALGGALGAALLGALVAGGPHLSESLHRAFFAVLVLAGVTLLLTLRAPLEAPARRRVPGQSAPRAAR